MVVELGVAVAAGEPVAGPPRAAELDGKVAEQLEVLVVLGEVVPEPHETSPARVVVGALGEPLAVETAQRVVAVAAQSEGALVREAVEVPESV